MPDWSSGYVADTGYTYGAYYELNPLRVRLALLNAGFAFPSHGTACELGFGQGMSTNIHAAASVTEWYGTDFNPSQAGLAQELAESSGAQVKLYDQSFAEFCSRADLPEFDYIGLHGIWSWVSDEDRNVIVDFVRRKLKVGGILYVSYNVMQGLVNMVPVREVMNEYSHVMVATGSDTLSKVDGAVEFMQRLMNHAPSFAAANPMVQAKLDSMRNANRSYLAHEYFNRNWTPMSFSAMAKWLEPAKLDFACSAHYFEHLDFLQLNEDQTKILGEIENTNFRETVRDFLVNQQFRRDYWVRGARKLGAVQKRDLMLLQRVVLTSRAEDISLEQKTLYGTMNLSQEVYQPILHLMSDHKVRTIGQIVEHCTALGSTFSQITQAVFILASLTLLEAAQESDVINKSKPQTDRLNRKICSMAVDIRDIGFLASPVTGGLVQIHRFGQLFLLGRARGSRTPEEWAEFANQCLHVGNQRLNIDGRTFEGEQQLAELTRMAERFERQHLPLLTALQVPF